MYAFSQGEIFIIFLIIGLTIGIFFDFFRALRKTFKTPDFVTCLEDIVFMAIAGILIVNTLLLVNNGQLRFYIIIAILLRNILLFFNNKQNMLHYFSNIYEFFQKNTIFSIFY